MTDQVDGELYVVIEEGESGTMNVWGPYADYQDAQTAALIELISRFGLDPQDEIVIVEPSREGPWHIYTDNGSLMSWAVAPVVSLANEKIHQINKEHHER